jgi:hypothetical protein
MHMSSIIENNDNINVQFTNRSPLRTKIDSNKK